MNSLDRAWLAGLLEGEGSFLWMSDRRARVTCGMTDKDVLERVFLLCGGKIWKQKYKAKDHHKDVWIWYLEGQDAVNLMEELHPHMGIRRSSKIKEVVEAYEERKRDQELTRSLRKTKRELVYEDYIRTGDSLRELGKRHGVSHVTVKNYIYKVKRSRRPDPGVSGTDC